MLPNQDLCLSVILLLAITSLSQAGVINETPPTPEKYPFVVTLRFSGSSCLGSIISQNFVMTAAQCTDRRSVESFSVQYGVTNVVGVKKIIQHEEYDPTRQFANDISLLMVEKPFVFDGVHVAPVTLPAQAFVVPQSDAGVQGVLISWGYNEIYGVVQDTFQEVSLKIYSDAECIARHDGKTDPRYHICGGLDEGGKGQCGYSGGPLLYQGQQVGIVSWGITPCTLASYPGVYCKVSNYIDWIKRNQIELE